MAERRDLLHSSLQRIVEARETLSRDEAAALMRYVLAGHDSDVQFAALLGAMGARGETSAEVAGFASAMREAAVPLPLADAEREELVDTCGTGGDASGSFNISTAAALVAAGAGAKVAKHGNRAITSRCGSADVLDALGIPTRLTPEQSAAALRRHGFCFLLAPAHHPALAAGMPVRRELRVRTVLHVLGPLLNPAGARRQVMGVYAARLVPLVAEAMTMLGADHAFVVHGHGGLDELALSGPSNVAEVRRCSTGGSEMQQYGLRPEDFDLQQAPISALAGGDAEENAAILSGVFAGEPGPRRDVVVLNAAAVLTAAGVVQDMHEGVVRAAHAIDSHAVARLVEALRAT